VRNPRGGGPGLLRQRLKTGQVAEKHARELPGVLRRPTLHFFQPRGASSWQSVSSRIFKLETTRGGGVALPHMPMSWLLRWQHCWRHAGTPAAHRRIYIGAPHSVKRHVLQQRSVGCCMKRA
jgi:hypothetical protein